MLLEGGSKAASSVRIPILMYHQVDAVSPKRDNQGRRVRYRSLTVSPRSFSRQMWLLRLLGFRGVSMSEVMRYLRGEKTIAQHGRIVGITFDDGYENNVTHALPTLVRYGFSSTCYVVSQHVGQLNTWDAEKGIESKSLMTVRQMRQWLESGQEIGSHTRHHVDLKALDLATSATEITVSKSELQAQLGCACQHFCYPYGRFDDAHAAMARDAGYVSATTTQHAVASCADDPFALPRLGVYKNTTLFGFWRMIRTSMA